MLLENLQTAHHFFKRRILFLVDAVDVMQAARAIDTQTNQKPVLAQEPAPLVIQQGTVGLERIMNYFSIGVLGLEGHHLAEEIHSQQRRFASLPGKADF